MNIKRYLVKDMQEAMVKIRNQLGPDAVILSNRPVRKKGLAGLFAKPLIEVMVAYESEVKAGAARPSKAEETAPAAPLPASAVLSAAPSAFTAYQPPVVDAHCAQAMAPSAPAQDEKLTEMEKRLESMNAAMLEIAGKLHTSPAAQRYRPEIQRQYLYLLEQEVEESIARAIADEAQDIADRRKVDPMEALEQVIRIRLGDAEGIKLQKFHRTVIVFVGPTGAGKTTTIAKLAAKYAIHEKAKVGLITADAYRIAAHEQIKTYSDILEVPLKAIYKPDEIAQALAELDDADIVLIDTPGKSPNDRGHQAEIASIIAKSNATGVFLVISAATGYKSCMMIAEQYRFIKDFRVLLTKTDETVTAGMCLNARALTGMPLSYVTTGQSVPDDIELFDPAAATKQLMWKA